jgi:hypothetical protein
MKFFSKAPLKPTSRVLRQFAAAWLVCFLALAFRFGLLRHSTAGSSLCLLSIAGIIGLLAPRALYWPFIVLTVAAFPIGWAMTQLVLALMFYCVLSPLALVFRCRRRDSLQLRQGKRDSFWVERKESPAPENYLKQF